MSSTDERKYYFIEYLLRQLYSNSRSRKTEFALFAKYLKEIKI